jgi:hypothetical protein
MTRRFARWLVGDDDLLANRKIGSGGGGLHLQQFLFVRLVERCTRVTIMIESGLDLSQMAAHRLPNDKVVPSLATGCITF